MYKTLVIIACICLSFFASLTSAKLVKWSLEELQTNRKNTKNYFFINFLNPSCSHCKASTPSFEAASKELESTYPDVTFVNADVIKDPELSRNFKLKGTPTFIWIDPKRDLVSDLGEIYTGSRTTSAFISFVESKLAAQNTKEQSRRAEPSVSSSGKVIELTPDNFDEYTLDSNIYTFVMFYAPWCGWCKKARPDFEKLAELFKDESKVVVAALDAAAYPAQGTKYGVTGYPTFKLFVPDLKDPVNYQQQRTLKDFAEFLNIHANTNVLIPSETAGVIPAFDTHVKQFMLEAEKAATLKKLEKTLEDTPEFKKGHYFLIMKKVVSEGLGYIQNESDRIQALIAAKGNYAKEKLDSFIAKQNILKVFKKYLNEAGHAEL